MTIALAKTIAKSVVLIQIKIAVAIANITSSLQSTKILFETKEDI